MGKEIDLRSQEKKVGKKLKDIFSINAILRAGENREQRKLSRIKNRVLLYRDQVEAELEGVSPEDRQRTLTERTHEFKDRYQNGESLDDLLVEAFAVACVAAKDVLGYDDIHGVQIMGATSMHLGKGRMIDMKTGEGKTLTAAFTAYLNALAGEGVHVVTVNDYLAKRDAEWMGKMYNYLGLEVGVILPNRPSAEHRTAYQADITYGTNNEFGFDYLRDNMAWSEDELVQRGHFCAIVDEVDSILIDEARTPLIISGPAENPSRWHSEFAKAVATLQPGKEEDYEVDLGKRTVAITEKGVKKIEDELGIDNLYDIHNTPLVACMEGALKAKELFKRDKDYIVHDGEILIVDEFTGRILYGRRYNDGIHQAIEAKEKVGIKQENQTLATITLQNYFRLYGKLSGMSGTAQSEAAEFMRVYSVPTDSITQHKPLIRDDRPDVIYKSEKAKFNAVVEDIIERHRNGQPVLIGTANVHDSEVLSQMLHKKGIQHNVLNAKYHAQEADIIAQAGRVGAVTVATNMAGRGTDILLGGNPEYLAKTKLKTDGIFKEDDPEKYEQEYQKLLKDFQVQVADEHNEVVGLGGLYVLGTQRHDSRRIDNQLIGRSGRQGEPGESRYYLSLEDELLKRFRADAVAAVMERLNIPDDVPIESKMVTRMIRSAQVQIEAQNAEVRKDVLKYDEVYNKQRQIVYKERRDVLEAKGKGKDLRPQILGFIDDVVDAYVDGATGTGMPEEWDLTTLFDVAFAQIHRLSFSPEDLFPEDEGDISRREPDVVRDEIKKRAKEDLRTAYDQRIASFGEKGEEIMARLERQTLLDTLDRKWKEHLYEMDYLKGGIHLRAYAQRDPLVEFQREGFDLFNQMIAGMKEEVVGSLFNPSEGAEPKQ